MLNFHSLIDITMLGDCFFFLQTNLEQKIMNLEQRNLDLMTKDTGLETKVVDLMSKDVDLVSKFVSILQLDIYSVILILLILLLQNQLMDKDTGLETKVTQLEQENVELKAKVMFEYWSKYHNCTLTILFLGGILSSTSFHDLSCWWV